MLLDTYQVFTSEIKCQRLFVLINLVNTAHLRITVFNMPLIMYKLLLLLTPCLLAFKSCFLIPQEYFWS